jgi:hypothetical protein
MKKTLLMLVVLTLCFPVVTFAANGQPFQDLQNQINTLNTLLQNIQLTPGPPGPAGPQGPPGPAGSASLDALAGSPCTAYDGTQSVLSYYVAQDGTITFRCPAAHPFTTELVFITSTSTNGNIGGLAAADAICQNLANAAGLSGTFLAWLSDSTQSPSTRFNKSSGPYVLLNGTVIAYGWDDLISGHIRSSIVITEQGNTIPGGFSRVWTSTRPDGTPIGIASGGQSTSCKNWTTNDPLQYGWNGMASLPNLTYCGTCTGQSWTWEGDMICSAGTYVSLPMRLYCFQQ